MDPLAGTMVAGRYRVIEPIGSGGMGTVYRAVQENLGREVALKVIKAQHLTDTEAVARFEREARTIAKLSHDAIVTIFDFGTLDEGGLYIAMELLRGKPLTTLVSATKPVDFAHSLLLMRDVARALVAAHSHGIIHRDLKPDNIMVIGSGADERCKVLDFGVAKLQAGANASSTLTGAGMIVGTPAYMAPEVVMGVGDITERADLFSFGLVWIELLTGHRPFDADSPTAALVQVATKPIPSLIEAGVAVPEPVSALVAALVQKDPALRTPSAAALLEAIELCIERTASGAFPQPGRLVQAGAERALRRTLSDDDGVGPGVAGPRSGATLAMGSLGQAGAIAGSGPATPPTAAGLTVPAAMPARPSKTPAMVAGGLLLLAIVGIAAASRFGTPAAPVVAPPALVAAVAPTAPVTPTPTPPPPAATTIAPPPAATADLAALVASDAPSAVAPVATTPTPPTTATAATTATTANAASVAPTSRPKRPRPGAAVATATTAPAALQPLTSDVVEAAIQQNLGKATACRNTNITNARSGGGLLVDHCPSYKTLGAAQQLYVTIAPSGAVTGVRLREGAIATDPLAACVLESLKGWRFPAFAGEPVEIGQRLSFKTCVPINGKCVFSR